MGLTLPFPSWYGFKKPYHLTQPLSLLADRFMQSSPHFPLMARRLVQSLIVGCL